MPLGQVGEGNYGLVYTTLPTGLGYRLGDVTYPAVSSGNGILYNGNAVTLLQVTSGQTVTANAAVQLTGGATVFQVQNTSAINQTPIGCNDLSGGSVTTQQFFFATTAGYTSVLEAAAVGAQVNLSTSATSGTLIATVAGTNNPTEFTNQVASGAGGATLAYIQR